MRPIMKTYFFTWTATDGRECVKTQNGSPAASTAEGSGTKILVKLNVRGGDRQSLITPLAFSHNLGQLRTLNSDASTPFADIGIVNHDVPLAHRSLPSANIGSS